MALCGLNRWGGDKSPLLSQEQGGEQAGGERGAHPSGTEARRGRVEEEGDPLPLRSSSVSSRRSASQRRGLPAGPPRDLASLGLCEHRRGNR